MSSKESGSYLPALLSVHIATLLFGLAGVLGAVAGLNAFEVTFGRTLFASVALLAVCYYFKRPTTSNTVRPVLTLMVLSGALLAFHWVVFFASIQVSTVAIGLVTFSTCPVFVALFEPLFFREKFKLTSLLASCCVLSGVVIISGVHSGDVAYLPGILLGISSGASFAVLQLLNRKLGAASGPVVTALIQNAVATILLLPVVVLGLGAIQLNQWALLIFLGVGCTALAHTLFIDALKSIKVATASLIAAGLEPLYGIALAALFLAQLPPPNVMMGGSIILITVSVMTLQSRKT